MLRTFTLPLITAAHKAEVNSTKDSKIDTGTSPSTIVPQCGPLPSGIPSRLRTVLPASLGPADPLAFIL